MAGPLFNDHERDFLEAIALNLEKEGFKWFLPHRDLTGVEESVTKDNIYDPRDKGQNICCRF